MSVMIRDFRRCELGGAALLLALLLPVLIVMVGGAIDYSRAARLEQDLQDAAEAAVLAAANDGRLALLSNDISGEQELVAYVEEAAIQRFQAKMSSSALSNVTEMTPNAALVDNEIHASMVYSGNAGVSFLQLVGLSDFHVAGNSRGSVSLPRYFHITFAFDVSGSMGIGADRADQDMMLADFGCAFSCHVEEPSSHDRAKEIGARMRIDDARDAALELLDAIEYEARTVDQFTFSLYEYDTYPEAIIAPGDPDASDFAYVRTRIGEVDMNRTRAGTNTARALRQIGEDVPASGLGNTPANRRQFLFVLTDGVEDTLVYDTTGESGRRDPDAVYNSPYRNASNDILYAMDPVYACTDLNAKNVETYFVHTRQVPIDYAYINSWQRSRYDYIKDVIFPILPERYSACAGVDDHFVSTDQTAEIIDSLVDMFESELNPLRLY